MQLSELLRRMPCCDQHGGIQHADRAVCCMCDQRAPQWCLYPQGCAGCVRADEYDYEAVTKSASESDGPCSLTGESCRSSRPDRSCGRIKTGNRCGIWPGLRTHEFALTATCEDRPRIRTVPSRVLKPCFAWRRKSSRWGFRTGL